MANREQVNQAFRVVSVLEPTDTGAIASPVYSSSYNMNDQGHQAWNDPNHGWRFLAILRAALSVTGAIANGVTFSIEDSADNSSWAAKAEVDVTLAKITTSAKIQTVSFWPAGKSFRPWIRIKALSDNNATLFSVSALIVAIRPGAL